MSFAEKLKEKRTACRMTLESLAIMVGTSRQTIQRYESGRISTPPYERIEALAAALSTTPSELMGWEEDTDDPLQLGEDDLPYIIVKDDAMAGDRILERDTVCYRPTDEVADGQLMVVVWQGCTMLRRIHVRGEALLLVSSSPVHPPVLVPPEARHELSVLGIAALLKSVL